MMNQMKREEERNDNSENQYQSMLTVSAHLRSPCTSRAGRGAQGSGPPRWGPGASGLRADAGRRGAAALGRGDAAGGLRDVAALGGQY